MSDDIAKLEKAHGQLQKVIDGLTAELAVAQRRADYLSKDFDRDIKLYQAELAAEREARIALAKEAKEAALEVFAEYDAKVAKLREALEDAAIALDGWDDEAADAARAAAAGKETADE